MIYSKTEIEEGQLLLIDKPLNWTSFDVVNKLRYALRKAYGFKKLKVGHAGTLDPLATGLLLIAVGRKTKTINDLMGMDKVYTGTFKIGATTPSYDLETEVDQQWSTEGISEEDIQKAADQFKGLIDQVPPIFSAIKQGGKKAYEMAREGEKPELKSRQVMIHDFKVDAKAFPEVDFEVKCSKGTYIRSLAHDFGAALNNGAHLTALRREAIGPYSIKDALSLEGCLEIFRKEE
ncbi:tRNA pseudouridine(55) synthase TruB [Croceimicrobium sp.]|uniref:tRNA pseudouridine(55) synthase TruB n=1 Tax=Croceimicrobium sp. TaxID=2828340 RepID=UPI003BABC82B